MIILLLIILIFTFFLWIKYVMIIVFNFDISWPLLHVSSLCRNFSNRCDKWCHRHRDCGWNIKSFTATDCKAVKRPARARLSLPDSVVQNQKGQSSGIIIITKRKRLIFVSLICSCQFIMFMVSIFCKKRNTVNFFCIYKRKYKDKLYILA